jgi:hypothetical protein
LGRRGGSQLQRDCRASESARTLDGGSCCLEDGLWPSHEGGGAALRPWDTATVAPWRSSKSLVGGLDLSPPHKDGGAAFQPWGMVTVAPCRPPRRSRRASLLQMQRPSGDNKQQLLPLVTATRKKKEPAAAPLATTSARNGLIYGDLRLPPLLHLRLRPPEIDKAVKGS